MGNSNGGLSTLRKIPQHILRYQSPDLTLIEFEQIYDEYIQLCGNQQAKLESEHIFVHLLSKSIFLSEDEKQAIVNEELGHYLTQLKANEQPFEQAADTGIEEAALNEPVASESNEQDNKEYISEEGKQGQTHAGVLLEQPSLD